MNQIHNNWKRSIKILSIGILLGWTLLGLPIKTFAATCSCSGSVSVNVAGQVAAVAAGYSQTDFESECKNYGFSASGWTCSGSLEADTSKLGADCDKVDSDFVINALGLTSYSIFISASLSCTEIEEDSSSSSGTSSGGGGKICSSSKCTKKEVGPFMQDISQGCGNLGDCTLGDIIMVFVNIGNYVIGIIGAVVLLMYVAGGFFWLASAGRKEWVDKGKKYMTISTMGLLIVMFSYLGIYALKGALQYGTFKVSGEYVTCTGSETEGDPCDLNSTCSAGGFACLSLCQQQYNKDRSFDVETGLATWYTCIDRSEEKTEEATTEDEKIILGNFWYTASTCQQNLCPGDENQQCCQMSKYE